MQYAIDKVASNTYKTIDLNKSVGKSFRCFSAENSQVAEPYEIWHDSQHKPNSKVKYRITCNYGKDVYMEAMNFKAAIESTKKHNAHTHKHTVHT